MRRLSVVAQQRPQGSFLFGKLRCIGHILSLSSYERVVFLARDHAFQLDQLHVHAATALSTVFLTIVLFLILPESDKRCRMDRVSSDESKARVKPGFLPHINQAVARSQATQNQEN